MSPKDIVRDFVRADGKVAADPDARRFWTGRLAGHEPASLPRWPGTGGGPRRTDLDRAVPDDVTARLTDLAARLGMPVRTVLLSAHAKVVGAATGRHDVVTG